ncbi:MAG: AAA family ATPase [Clostridia bacterium]|nr:AAA family ATPase [Clostridia bacterium]
MVTHQEYGEQFKIDTFEKLMPENSKALEKYLASGAIHGIGPATAKKIIEKFGEEAISIFKFEPLRLAEIKGISKDKAYEIGEEFNEKWELWQIVGFLEKFGISANNSKKVYDALGKDAVKKIEDNPYLLVDVVYGVDFYKIDKIALEIGIPKDNDYRIKSGIKYALLTASYNGHLCVQKENLIEFVTKTLEVSENEIEDNLINLKVQEEIVIEIREDGISWIYLYPLYKVEQNISEKLFALNEARNFKFIKDFEEDLKVQEEKLGIKLSSKQFEALNQINTNNVCIITGGPGTGKTTIIKVLLEVYKLHKRKVVLCAPTGRAAKRMSETTGQEAKTIHRLLEIGKIEDDKIHNIDVNLTPIDGDVIVIDEMSMVDSFLMNYIVKAIYQGSKLVLVGDSNQLPSVGPGSILKDLIDSEKFATVHLNKIFRQAAKSKIIVNSHNVNNGISFIGNKTKDEEQIDDFFYINEQVQEKMLYQVLSLSNGRLANFGNYDFFKNIQVLTPTKKGILGTKELNTALQNELNPKTEEKKEKQYGSILFREGDRVMQIKNNYDIYWEKGSSLDLKSYEVGSGIFNGELGRIIKINNSEKNIEVEFDDGKIAWYEFSELDEIELAYAITVHKAQR